MDVVMYARVSTEEQAQGDRVSIEQQLGDMRALCGRNGWNIQAEMIDHEDYRATQVPHKGRIVPPSGERADRPGLLEVLELLRQGGIDALVCWRDDRLMRHPRVAVALEDALDTGDARRNGGNKIGVYDATGAQIDRFTLSIKAVIWREENKRRAERSRMGKIGTLKQGRWPGGFQRFGYRDVVEFGQRGRVIEVDEEEARIVQQIFDLYEQGETSYTIRKILMASGANQKGLESKKYDWGASIISAILRSEEYTGIATWKFAGESYTIEIPAIITREQWERVQKLIDKNKRFSTRNAKNVFMLQGILECGECGGVIGVEEIRYHYRKLADGTYRRHNVKSVLHKYRCQKGIKEAYKETHPRPFVWIGTTLDWAIWRKIVDDGIKRPEYIEEQILNHQQALMEQGDSIDGDISRARLRLAEIEEERATYQRQLGRKRITENEFDSRMDETDEARQYWDEQLKDLLELRDNRDKVSAGLDYARRLMLSIQEKLPEIDQSPTELRRLPEEARREIIKARREIILALVDKIIICADGNVKIEGVLDDSPVSSFVLEGASTRRHLFLD
jgi:DNA invertase Pin-like site-specific DNA recombinase